MLLRLSLPLLAVVASFCAGCHHPSKYSEFRQTFNFAALDTYQMEAVKVSGSHLKAPQTELLKSLSEDILAVQMETKGFTMSDEPDFLWTLRWHKQTTYNPSALDSVNGFREELNRSDDPSQRLALRWQLTLEARLPGQVEPFWVKELPNVFDAIELSEWRIIAAVERGMKPFPHRVEKDPNLPSIE